VHSSDMQAVDRTFDHQDKIGRVLVTRYSAVSWRSRGPGCRAIVTITDFTARARHQYVVLPSAYRARMAARQPE
jgi:hypothetical protein